MVRISPTLLCSNPLELKDNLQFLNRQEIAWYHADIMDGHFVPNLAIGLDWLKDIVLASDHDMYVHAMVTDPMLYINRVADMGVSFFGFHIEAVDNPAEIITAIRNAGMQAGIALNPCTEVSSISPYIDNISIVTLMGINPGFSGQVFFESTYDKIAELRQLIGKRDVKIEMDGGADDKIICKCLKAGADVVVSGIYSIFSRSGSISSNYDKLLMEMGL